MLSLKSVNKTYTPKRASTVHALKDTTLSFKNCGLVFILGKSGSGKSTLLNLIGGLDKPTSGEICYCNKSFSNFKSSDFDNYRNNVVGFVFQDYNLIGNLNVYQNIELVSSLQGEKGQDKIESALSEVGLAGYQFRKIEELSGGQKQRVAIARALAKDSRIILADEPTGNLDSETSKEIFDILKRLSKEKLVIVVTHDKESAEKYGDRVITIKDGVIDTDSNAEHLASDTYLEYKPQRARLSSFFALKISFRNLMLKKIKTILAVFLSVLTVFLICMAQTQYNYDTERNIILSSNKIEKNLLTYRSFSGYDQYGYPAFIDEFGQKAIKFLDSNDIVFFKEYKGAGSGNRYIINDLSELKQNGIDLYSGYKPLRDDGIYVSDYFIAYYLAHDGEIDYEGSLDFEKIAGSTLTVMRKVHDGSLIVDFKERILGVFKTDYLKYVNEEMAIEEKTKEEEYEQMQDFLSLAFAGFCTKAYYSSYHQNSNNSVQIEGANQVYNLSFTTKSLSLEIKEKRAFFHSIDYPIYALTENGYVNFNNVSLKPDEILISISMYNDLFGYEIEPLSWSNQPANFDERNPDTWYLADYVPQMLNMTVDVNLIQKEIQEEFMNLKNLKVIGIVINNIHRVDDSENEYEIYLGTDVIKENMNIDYFLNPYLTGVMINSDTDGLYSLTKDLRHRFNVGVNEYYSSISDFGFNFYAQENAVKSNSQIILIMAIVSAIISALVTVNLISFSITARKKEIGIMRAIGFSGGATSKIFIFESLLIGLFVLIFSILSVNILNHFINLELNNTYYTKLIYTVVDLMTYFIMFFMSIVFVLLASLIPIRKIIKMKPIDAIKDF